jgi:hypothetical protein
MLRSISNTAYGVLIRVYVVYYYTGRGWGLRRDSVRDEAEREDRVQCTPYEYGIEWGSDAVFFPLTCV